LTSRSRISRVTILTNQRLAHDSFDDQVVFIILFYKIA